MTFLEKLEARVRSANSLLCIGLDPDFDKLPKEFESSSTPLLDFNKAIIETTAEYACAYKPNSAFYEAHGSEGIMQLRETCHFLREQYPEIPIVLDFKRADIGNTNSYYTDFAFNRLGVDAVTIHPYLGREAVQPFLDHADKGVIVLCRTSNDGAAEFQDLEVDGKKLYLRVAENVKNNWNTNGNCLLVTGATYPEELAEIRATIGNEMWLLVPGIGAQGGDVAATVKAGGEHQIIASSRAIIYASNGDNFAKAAATEARKTRDEINKYRS